MRIITAKPLRLDYEKFKKRQPTSGEIGRIVSEDIAIYVRGKPVLAYTTVPKELLEGMREAVKTTKYAVTNRARGLPTKSSVFGAVPRSSLRCDYCRITRPTINEPENHARIIEFRKYVDDFYRRMFPIEFAASLREVTEHVHEDWRLAETPFLTCNINVNFAIPFHKDSGNMPSALSNVTIVREGIEGGELVLPEYGISLAQQDGALCFFDGRTIIHGVLPFKLLNENAYRASIVYYTLNSMKHCLSKPAEVERVQAKRTSLEAVSSEERRAKLTKALGNRFQGNTPCPS